MKSKLLTASNEKQIAKGLIDSMAQDNDAVYRASNDQIRALVSAISKMQKAGCQFTEDDISTLAAGDQDDRDEFKKYDGFDELDEVLTSIFEHEEEGMGSGPVPSPLVGILLKPATGIGKDGSRFEFPEGTKVQFRNQPNFGEDKEAYIWYKQPGEQYMKVYEFLLSKDQYKGI